MRKIILMAAVLSAVIVSPVAAQDRGFYLGGDLGLTISSGMDMTFTPGATAGTEGRIETDHKPGFNGAFLVGYDFGRIRIEGEASYLSADIDEATSDWAHAGGLVPGNQPVDGDMSARNALVNLIVDFGLGKDYSLFVGGGLGKTRLKVSNMALSQGGTVLLDDEDGDWRSSWQAIAGIRKPFTPNLEGHVRYRYLDVDGFEMVGLAGRTVEAGLTSHSVAVGITYHF